MEPRYADWQVVRCAGQVAPDGFWLVLSLQHQTLGPAYLAVQFDLAGDPEHARLHLSRAQAESLPDGNLWHFAGYLSALARSR